MITFCSDPTCDEYADLTLQRQLDVGPVPFCQPHGNARKNELDLGLVSYRLVSIARLPPSELEQAQAQVAELQAQLEPNDGPTAAELQEQLEKVLHTLELQNQLLDQARNDLSDRDDTIRILRLEIGRNKKEIERLQPPAPAAPFTPPPSTKPDPEP